MKFVADENIERLLILELRGRGHEVWSVSSSECGIPDDQVLERARGQDANLITGDKDFGELVYRSGERVRGVVLLRLQGLPLKALVQRSLEVIEGHLQELEGSFLVVTARQVRKRPLRA